MPPLPTKQAIAARLATAIQYEAQVFGGLRGLDLDDAVNRADCLRLMRSARDNLDKAIAMTEQHEIPAAPELSLEIADGRAAGIR